MDEIAYVMRVKGLSQKDFAEHKGVTRQSVNAVFTGRNKLLTGSGRELLEFLGVKVKLEVVNSGNETT